MIVIYESECITNDSNHINVALELTKENAPPETLPIRLIKPYPDWNSKLHVYGLTSG